MNLRSFIFLLIVMLFAVCVSGATISFSADKIQDFSVPNGGLASLYRLSYTVQGIQFFQNQELDIRFDPALYLSLSNGVAPAGFDLLLLQPGNPPGSPGDFSALALVDNPPLSGIFRVDVLATSRPVGQNFLINQLDSHGNILSTITSGVTISDVPEPSTSVMLLVGGIAAIVRLRFRKFSP